MKTKFTIEYEVQPPATFPYTAKAHVMWPGSMPAGCPDRTFFYSACGKTKQEARDGLIQQVHVALSNWKAACTPAPEEVEVEV